MKLDAASILLNPLQCISKSHSSFSLLSAAQRINSKSSNLQYSTFFIMHLEISWNYRFLFMKFNLSHLGKHFHIEGNSWLSL